MDALSGWGEAACVPMPGEDVLYAVSEVVSISVVLVSQAHTS
jgi:hypothetical protein